MSNCFLSKILILGCAPLFVAKCNITIFYPNSKSTDLILLLPKFQRCYKFLH